METHDEPENPPKITRRKPGIWSEIGGRSLLITALYHIILLVIGGSDSGAGFDKGAGTGVGMGSGGGRGIKFFGLQTNAKRIAFLLDYSGSMSGEFRKVMERELDQALKKLPPDTQLLVIP